MMHRRKKQIAALYHETNAMNKFTRCENGVIADMDAFRRIQTADSAALLLLSDTHGAADAAHWILSAFSGECQACLFAGDGAEDMITIAQEAATGRITIPPILIMAQGNCDSTLYAPVFPTSSTPNPFGVPVYQQKVIAQQRILLTHGNLYHVDIDSRKLCMAAENLDCTIAVHGHTHLQSIECFGSVTAINPGSPLRPRGKSYGGFAILSLQNTHNTNGSTAEPDASVQSRGTLRFYKLMRDSGGKFSAAVHTEYLIPIAQPAI